MPRLWPRPKQSTFPTVADVTAVAPDTPDTPPIDDYDASRALSALWRLCEMDLASVYHPHIVGMDGGLNTGPWAVWLEITQRKVDLCAWVREWLAAQEPEGNDAA